MNSKILVVLLVLFFTNAQASELVNISKVLVNGSDYDGKKISFSGYDCSNLDSKNGIFLSKDDCDNSNYNNAVQIMSKKRNKICEGLVTVTGVFTYKEGVVWLESPYLWGRLDVVEYSCMKQRK